LGLGVRREESDEREGREGPERSDSAHLIHGWYLHAANLGDRGRARQMVSVINRTG
jgi:hypothetical protein